MPCEKIAHDGSNDETKAPESDDTIGPLFPQMAQKWDDSKFSSSSEDVRSKSSPLHHTGSERRLAVPSILKKASFRTLVATNFGDDTSQAIQKSSATISDASSCYDKARDNEKSNETLPRWQLHNQRVNGSRRKLNTMNESSRGFSIKSFFDSSRSLFSGISDISTGEVSRPSVKFSAAKEVRETLGKSETKTINSLRLMVIGAMILGTIVISLLTFFRLKNIELDEFEVEYRVYSSMILDSFHGSLEREIEAIGTLAASITAHSLGTESTFPNVTIPSFEILGAHARTLSGCPFITWLPLVNEQSRKGWEEYSTTKQDHFNVSYLAETELRRSQDENLDIRRPRELHFSGVQHFHKEIWGNGSTSDGPYFPVWQMTPTLPYLTMLNKNENFDNFNTNFSKDILRTEEVMFGGMIASSPCDGCDLPDILTSIKQLGQYRHESEWDKNDWLSGLAHPVFDNFGEERKLVGILLALHKWSHHFSGILPPNACGIVCVLNNTYGQVITYRIDGPKVTQIILGDQHNVKYDDYEKKANIVDFLKKRIPSKTSYASVNLNSDVLEYTLQIYPSDEMKNLISTNRPITYSSVLASVLLFSLCIFLLFNRFVTKRQNIVMEQAVRSTSVVNSLFPRIVHDQLLHEGEDTSASFETNNSIYNHEADRNEGVIRGQQIAHKFFNTTILFADIAGFTKWSSTRSPEQVFQLLEAMYHEFDQIAWKKDVFKVETIGDCYMAVTGLPEPQEDHAVIMTQFAASCLIRMKKLMKKLEISLGDDTSELGLRVGLHSGEVTGGILRGEKSRFQLFGDTVNTASRMESNGMKGHIHCSQATADEIVSSGKEHWLSPRSDKIKAKGKGEMQTFWINLGSTKSLRSSECSSECLSEGPNDFNDDNATANIEKQKLDFLKKLTNVKSKSVSDLSGINEVKLCML